MKALKPIENINKSKEDRKMRTLTSIFMITLALFITSCSTNYYSTTPVYDDAYYTGKTVPAETEAVVVTDYTDNPVSAEEQVYGEGEFITDEEVYEMYEPAYDESYSYTDPDGKTYVTNNYYGDYYDYSYASRIRRFSYPYYSSYYSDYYGCPYCYDPWYYGSGLSMSIGFGWGWGSFGYSWGYPYYSWGYPSYGWYDPWWGYPYHGYGSYWNGYYDGYWNGYYDGSGYYYGGGYYPDYASVHYGPRNSREGLNTPISGGRSNADAGAVRSDGNLRGANIGSDQPVVGRGVANTQTGSGDAKSGTVNQRTGTDVNNANSRSGSTVSRDQNPSSATTRQAQDKNTLDLTRPSQNQRNTTNPSAEPSKRTPQQNPVTTKPAENRGNVNSRTKTYSSPVYTRPKSSQEYKAPGSGTVRQSTPSSTERNTYTRPANVTPRSGSQNQGNTVKTTPDPSRSSGTRTYSSPSNSGRSYSVPAPRSGSSNYSTPSRSGSRTYSTPSRSSSPSYSAPSRSSSPSYSAPSRSGSSGGSSSSHSSGSSSSGSSRSGGSSSSSGGRR